MKNSVRNIEDCIFLCAGCRACEQSCPRRAISFAQDAEGFLAPKINGEACVNCGICVKVCPQLHDGELQTPLKTLAAYEVDRQALLQSTSGGAFYAVAKSVVDRGGTVFGCVFDAELRATHSKADTIEALAAMRGSKYVQSDVGDTYAEVATLLRDGRQVLYTGTPCQIAGLLAFLRHKRIDMERLFTIDLVCHGVPSPGLFERYIRWYEKKHSCQVSGFEFRSKQKVGWENGCYVNICKKLGANDFHHSHKDLFEYAFLRGKTYRECCYRCKYAKTERVADMTIADYWGIEKEHPEFFNSCGVSLILVNTAKGESLMENTQGLRTLESDIEKARRYNKNLNCPMSRPQERDTIYKGLHEDDIDKYFRKNFKIRLGCKERLIVSLPTSLLLTIRRIKKQWKK